VPPRRQHPFPWLYPRRPAARVYLEPQRRWGASRRHAFDDEGQGIAPPHRRHTAACPRASSRRAAPGCTGSNGRCCVSITNTKDMLQSQPFPFCPCGPPIARVMLTSPWFVSGFLGLPATLVVSHPVDLFNRWPQRGGLVKHPPVPIHSLRTAPAPPGGRGLVRHGASTAAFPPPRQLPALAGGYLIHPLLIAARAPRLAAYVAAIGEPRGFIVGP